MKNIKRDCRIDFRVTKDEKDLILSTAIQKNISVADLFLSFLSAHTNPDLSTKLPVGDIKSDDAHTKPVAVLKESPVTPERKKCKICNFTYAPAGKDTCLPCLRTML